MIGLWDTTGNEVVKALAAERRSAGGVASGLALTLVAVVEEKKVREAEAAATIAASAHPCRLLIVVRSDMEGRSRLDAEIVVGGRLGPAEAVVMRMYGRLALHAESVVMPLLAPDVPVVSWWHQEPPDSIANDFLGVVADRRITDSAQAHDPVAALRQRALDYAPGDTDLTWTRITLWRTLVAGAFDTTDERGLRDGDPRGEHRAVQPHRPGGPLHAAAEAAGRRRAGRGAAPVGRRPDLRRGARCDGRGVGPRPAAGDAGARLEGPGPGRPRGRRG
jgi:glucose-6-phosphate dehydrogenase assembly protein OpcA